MKEINFSTLATHCSILTDHCSYDPGPDFILRGQMDYQELEEFLS